jgi:hypothetical protein
VERIRPTRRQFIIGSAAAFTTLMAWEAISAPAQTSSDSNHPTYFSVFGMHDTPNDGGSQNVQLAIDDLNILRAKYLVALNPSERLIEASLRSGIQLINRIYFNDNQFDETKTRLIMKKLSSYLEHPIVQPFNEVNNKGFTGNISITPEKHANDLIEAAELISSYGGITLITPMDQGFLEQTEGQGLTDYEYLAELAANLNTLRPSDWLKERVAIGSHAYTHIGDADMDKFDPRQLTPTYRIQKIDQIVRRHLGFQPDHYLLETGLWQDSNRPYPPEYYARETIRILDSPVDEDIRLKCACFWVYANHAQRPINHRRDPKQLGFEYAVWRGVNGPQTIYQKVAEYANKQLSN